MLPLLRGHVLTSTMWERVVVKFPIVTVIWF